MSEPTGSVLLDSGLTLSLGEHSLIHDQKIRNLSGSRVHVTIGRFCSIGPGLAILGSDEHPEWITMYPFHHELRSADWPGTQIQGATTSINGGSGDVSIGNDVWIGYGAKLFKGVIIGDGAVIAACSCVASSVAPYTIVAGTPAQPARKRFSDDEIAFLQRIRWWEWPADLINRRLPYLCSARISGLERIIQEAAPSNGAATENTEARDGRPVLKDESHGRPAASGLSDLAILRTRVGRMLGRGSPVSENELHAANLALVAAIKARDPLQYFAEHGPSLPAALRPLLLVQLASAWAQGDNAAAAALENLNRCMGQSQPAATPA